MKNTFHVTLLLAICQLTGCQKMFPLPMGGVVAAIKQASVPVPAPTEPGAVSKKSGVLMFIAAGQSNMVGQHPMEFNANPRLTVLFGDKKGPSIPFANALLDTYPDIQEIIIIRCAVNGSYVDSWKMGASNWNACMAEVAAANRPDAQMAGFLFYQGEADAKGAFGLWAVQFLTIIHDIRQTFNDSALPVVFCQLATTTDMANRPYWQLTKDLQASIHEPHVAMIKTDDQPLLDDVHLTMDGDEVVGERMARAYAGI